MKPASFRYVAPRSLGEAVAALAEHGDEARILAGGQSLVPMMNARIAKPAVLVSITRAPDLVYLRADAGTVSIGAATRQIDVERSHEVARMLPLLAKAIGFVGTTATRNRGTLCGSLAHADPLAELPAVAIALEASFHLVRAKGSRVVPAEEFFVGALTTAIEPDEVLAEVSFPVPYAPACVGGFAEVCNRQHGFAVAGIAAQFTLDHQGRCITARIVGIGYGDVPRRFLETERRFEGRSLSAAVLAEACEVAEDEAAPIADFHADAAYRRRVAPRLLGRVVEEARAQLSVGAEDMR